VNILNAPIQPNRNFEVMNIQRKHVDQNAVLDAKGRVHDGEMRQVWIRIIWIRNRADTSSKTVAMFPHIRMTVPHLRRIYRGGVLNDSICPSKDHADRIANAVCSILNRWPHPLNEKDWEDRPTSVLSEYQETRALIECLSLQCLDHSFKITPIFTDTKLNVTHGVRFMRERLSANKNGSSNMTLTWTPQVVAIPKRPIKENFVVSTSANAIDSNAIADIPDPPDWFQWHVVPFGPGWKEDERRDITKLATFANWKLFGATGTEAALHDAFREIIRPFLKPDLAKRSRRHNGPYGGRPALKVYNSGSQESIRIEPPSGVRATIQGDIPALSTAVRSGIQVAWALTQFYDTFNLGKGFFNAYQALAVAIERLGQGAVSVKEAGDYLPCLCRSFDERQVTAHVCTKCFKYSLCAYGMFTETGLFVCAHHGIQGEQTEFSLSTLKGTPFRSIICSIKGDQKLSKRYWTSEEREIYKERLISSLINDNTWSDAYNGKREFEESNWTELENKRIPALIAISVDAIYPMYVKGGRVFYHHHENTVATNASYNRLKGSDVPAIMPVYLYAAETKVCGSSPEASERWRAVNTAFDHCYMLRHLVPWARKTRFNLKLQTDDSVFEKSFLAPMRAGRFNLQEGSILPIYATRPVFKTRCHNWYSRSNKDVPKVWQMWTTGEIGQLDDLVTAMQDCPKINSRGLVVPRGTDGAPWLWRLEHMFSNHSWEFLWTEFRARYQTMNEWCDRRNETQESPATLVAEACKQWFVSHR
jgi:hypothetical protein